MMIQFCSGRVLALASLVLLPPTTLRAQPASAANPTAYLQYAPIVGAGPTFTVSRLPTTTSTGAIAYYDATITLTVGANGKLSATAAVVSHPSPNLKTAHFTPGTYCLAGDPKDATIQVIGPGVDPGGSTAWTLYALAPDSNTPLHNAEWTVGSLDPDVQNYMKQYNITPAKGESYGLGGYGATGGSNELIGLRQIGESLAVEAWYGSNIVNQLPYTLCSP